MFSVPRIVTFVPCREVYCVESNDGDRRERNTSYRFPFTMFMLGSMLFVIVANILYSLYCVLFR